jgi:hypothetical protein
MPDATNFNPADVAAALNDAVSKLDEGRKATFQFAQKVLQAKAAQLQREADAAKAAPAALKSQLAFFSSLSDGLDELSVNEDHLPKPTPDTFVIRGRITDPKGRPVKNLQLKITDPQGTIKDRIHPVVSDAQGYFMLTLRSAELPDLVQNKTDLFISVTDASGREVFKPAEAVRLEPGKVANFSATLTR